MPVRKAKRKHMILDSGYIKSSKSHHGIWLPLSLSQGLVLHRNGRPGVVVAHRSDIALGAKTNLNFERDALDTLSKRGVVEVTHRLKDPTQMIRLMRTHGERVAGPDFNGFTDKLNLSVLVTPHTKERIVSDLRKAAKMSKDHGLIGDYSIIKAKRGHLLFRVDATDGTIHMVRNKPEITSRIYNGKGPNHEWEE